MCIIDILILTRVWLHQLIDPATLVLSAAPVAALANSVWQQQWHTAVSDSVYFYNCVPAGLLTLS